MANTPESKVKKRVKEVLDELGAYYFMPATGGYRDWETDRKSTRLNSSH